MSSLSKIMLISGLLFPLILSAQTRVGGGGDSSEARVDEIRADILKWIEHGGARKLQFPSGLGLSEYESEMRKILGPKNVTVVFVETDHLTDKELQVQVDGKPKTCRGFISAKDDSYHILCNIQRFKDTKDDEQYRLVHHEYAGLAGIERNVGAASDYEISNQLSGHLRFTTVLRLAVQDSPLQVCGLTGSVSERIEDCFHKNASPSKDNFVLVARTEQLKEVHMDLQTGLLWGNVFSFKMNSEQAWKICLKAVEEMAEIHGLDWRLPTLKEYNKLKSKQPNLMTIWTYSDFLAGHDLVMEERPFTRCVANNW